MSVDSTTPTEQSIIEQKVVQDLPLNGRNPATFTFTVAGVTALAAWIDRDDTAIDPILDRRGEVWRPQQFTYAGWHAAEALAARAPVGIAALTVRDSLLAHLMSKNSAVRGRAATACRCFSAVGIPALIESSLNKCPMTTMIIVINSLFSQL